MGAVFPETVVKFWKVAVSFFAIAGTSEAAIILVKGESGEPLAQVMVTRSPVERPSQDLSDDGYTGYKTNKGPFPSHPPPSKRR